MTLMFGNWICLVNKITTVAVASVSPVDWVLSLELGKGHVFPAVLQIQSILLDARIFFPLSLLLAARGVTFAQLLGELSLE